MTVVTVTMPGHYDKQGKNGIIWLRCQCTMERAKMNGAKNHNRSGTYKVNKFMIKEKKVRETD